MRENKDLLRLALDNGYAVPAFNYSDIWEFLAIAEAAEELQAPVYTASTMLTVHTVGMDYCSAFAGVGYRNAGSMLYNHLDHCTSVEMCERALDYGYQSVMFDGSGLPIDENIALTGEVARAAHARGVFVEAEVGQILGEGEEGSCDGGGEPVTPEQCVRMVVETGVNSLAVGIGNQHGFYGETPKLNVALLSEVRRHVDIPLVLHGGSGLGEDVIRDCIRRGVAKVNVGTALHYAYKTTLCDEFLKHPEGYVFSSFAMPAKEAVKDVIRYWIRLRGAENKRRHVREARAQTRPSAVV